MVWGCGGCWGFRGVEGVGGLGVWRVLGVWGISLGPLDTSLIDDGAMVWALGLN